MVYFNSKDTLLDKVSQTPLEDRLVGFVHVLRSAGYKLGTLEELETLKVLETLGLTDRFRFQQGLKSLFCASHKEWKKFDTIFEKYWYSQGSSRYTLREKGALGELNRRSKRKDDEVSRVSFDTKDIGSDGASKHNVDASKDFEHIENAAEMSRMENLTEAIAKRLTIKFSRRRKSVSHGSYISMKKTLRNSLSYGGDFIYPVFEKKTPRPSRLLVLVDVSRSMAVYGYLFLRFARGLVDSMQEVRVVGCHTKPIHLTDALKRPSLVGVRRALNLVSNGWAGGTKLADCFSWVIENYDTFMSSKTVVVVVSDGLDTCTPKLMQETTHYLRSKNRKLVWLNPLFGKQGYAVKTSSMRAALPNIDVFAKANSLQTLQALENTFARL